VCVCVCGCVCVCVCVCRRSFAFMGWRDYRAAVRVALVSDNDIHEKNFKKEQERHMHLVRVLLCVYMMTFVFE
jgi:hypothetical protein